MKGQCCIWTVILGIAIGGTGMFAAEPRASDFPALVRDLASSDFAVRQQATQQLREAGPEAISLLAQSLRSGDREVRSRAIDILLSHALSLRSERREPALAALRDAADGDDPQAAQIAQGALEGIRDVTSALAAGELSRLGATVQQVENTDPPQYNVQVRASWRGGDDRLALLWELGGVPWLSLENAPVTDAALVHVARLKPLTKLYLGGSQITGDRLADLAPLENVQHLSLKGLPIHDGRLAKLPNLKYLRFLGLDGTHITDTGLKELARYPGLQTLWLDGTRVTDAGLVHLRPLANLRTLFLPKTATAGPGLAELRYLPSLTYLSLKGTKQTTESLKIVGSLSQLESLGLDDTNITDEQLAELTGLAKLRILWLSNTAVSDAGIASLKKLPGLQVLYLTSTQISAEGLEELRKALPTCHVAR